MGDAERARNFFIDAVAGGTEDALSHLGLAHLRMVEGNTSAALPGFRRGAGLDSVLAEPFVLAWRLNFVTDCWPSGENTSGTACEAAKNPPNWYERPNRWVIPSSPRPR